MNIPGAGASLYDRMSFMAEWRQKEREEGGAGKPNDFSAKAGDYGSAGGDREFRGGNCDKSQDWI